MTRKILFICQYFYPEYISSATLPYDTAIKLNQKGYKVDVVTGYPKEYITQKRKLAVNEIHQGISIKRIKYLTLNRKNKISRLINYFSFTSKVLIKLLTFKKYEYIYVYSNPPLLPYVAYLSNKLFKTKIIYILYDIYPEIALYTNSIKVNGLIHRMMNHINTKVFRIVSKVVVLSEDMKNFLLSKRKIEKEKIEVIENWYHQIDNAILLNDNLNTKFDNIIHDKRFKIVYTGNLGIAQDPKAVLNMIKNNINSNWVLFIFSGHGSKMDELKLLKEELFIENLYVFDFLHGEEYDKLLLLADAYLLSLKKELSGLASPSKMYSYLAGGKPIIGLLDSNSELSNRIKNFKLGVVIDPIYSYRLEVKLREIINRDKYQYICQNVLKIFLKLYETNKGTQKYIQLMNELEGISDER
jgi:glycosyltransferase involved in cell wall biosynthesis